MPGIGRAVSAVNRACVVAAAVLILAILAIIIQDIFFRRFLNAPSAWSFDVSRYAMVYVVFLGLAPALESGHHVAIDMFDPLLPKALARRMPLVANALTVTFGGILLWYVAKTTRQAFLDNEVAASIVPVPLKWLYLAGPIGAFQFLITALALAFGWFDRRQPAREH